MELLRLQLEWCLEIVIQHEHHSASPSLAIGSCGTGVMGFPQKFRAQGASEGQMEGLSLGVLLYR